MAVPPGPGRRQVLAAVLAAMVPSALRAAIGVLAAQVIALPEPAAQIAVDEDGVLLAIDRSGRLWRMELGVVLQIGEGLDSDTPLAAAHGRIAGRRIDGGLWLLDAGRVRRAAGVELAATAGLLLLPAGLIGVETVGAAQRPVRLEPGASGDWQAVARSDIGLLPDARPLQAALDGEAYGGHVVLLAGPDAERYPHGVLGDGAEATRIVYLERHSLGLLRELRLPPPRVLEDIAPRRVRLAAGDGLLSVLAGPDGGQLVLIGADPAAAGALAILARGAPIGTRFRWLAPSTDGGHWLAVHTPHLGGVLHEYRQDGAKLASRRIAADLSNHRIGSRVLDIGSWSEGRVLLPDQAGRTLRLLDARQDWAVVATLALPAPVAQSLALGQGKGHALRLADGQVMVASLRR